MGTDSSITVYANGIAVHKGKKYQCFLGRSGVVKDKREGDGATPAGCFPIREVYYRTDRLEPLHLALPTRVIARDDAWCDDPSDLRYNTRISVQSPHEESLWREDSLYDVVAVLGYNDTPVVRGKGSAIFMHCRGEGHAPTAGCVAFTKQDILEILKNCTRETVVCVRKNPWSA